MEEIARFVAAHQPPEGFKTAMCRILAVVYPRRRRMGYQYVDVSSAEDPIPEHPGNESPRAATHLPLGELILSPIVTDRAAQSGNEHSLYRDASTTNVGRSEVVAHRIRNGIECRYGSATKAPGAKDREILQVVVSEYEEMKVQNVTRGLIVTSSTFSKRAIEFAETRPIDLYNRDKLQSILQKIDL